MNRDSHYADITTSSFADMHALSHAHKGAGREENELEWIVHAKSNQSDEVRLRGNKVFTTAAAPIGSPLLCKVLMLCWCK